MSESIKRYVWRVNWFCKSFFELSYPICFTNHTLKWREKKEEKEEEEEGRSVENEGRRRETMVWKEKDVWSLFMLSEKLIHGVLKIQINPYGLC